MNRFTFLLFFSVFVLCVLQAKSNSNKFGSELSYGEDRFNSSTNDPVGFVTFLKRVNQKIEEDEKAFDTRSRFILGLLKKFKLGKGQIVTNPEAKQLLGAVDAYSSSIKDLKAELTNKLADANPKTKTSLNNRLKFVNDIQRRLVQFQKRVLSGFLLKYNDEVFYSHTNDPADLLNFLKSLHEKYYVDEENVRRVNPLYKFIKKEVDRFKLRKGQTVNDRQFEKVESAVTQYSNYLQNEIDDLNLYDPHYSYAEKRVDFLESMQTSLQEFKKKVKPVEN